MQEAPQRSGPGGGPLPPGPASYADLPGADELTDEERVLLVLARLHPPAEELEGVVEVAGRPGFDWSTLLELATRLWVHPLVAASALAEPLLDLLPDPVRRSLDLSTLAARIRRGAHRRAMGPVLEAWEEAGIHATVLKGAALAGRLYPPGTRIVNDLDLWVPPRRHAEAARSLREAGFARVPVEGGSEEANLRDQNGLTFVHYRPEGGPALLVDLHHRLHPAHSPFALDAAACTEAGEGVSFGDVSLAAFNREDTVVHLATQLAGDVVVKPHRVADLVALVGGRGAESSAPDWNRMAGRAEEARAQGALALALRWASAGGAHVPGELVEELEAAVPGSRDATGVLLDVRALLPRFRLPPAGGMALASRYAPAGAARRRLLAAIPGTVWARQRRGGEPLAASLWHTATSIPAAGAALLTAAEATRLREAGKDEAAARRSGRLWRARTEPTA